MLRNISIKTLNPDAVEIPTGNMLPPSIDVDRGLVETQVNEVFVSLHQSSILFDVILIVMPQKPSSLSDKLQKIRKKFASELSTREFEVLQLFLNGFSIKEVAAKLFISFETVKSHRKNILLKTGVKKISLLSKLFPEMIRTEM